YTLRLTVQNNLGEIYRDSTIIYLGCMDLYDIAGMGNPTQAGISQTNVILCPGNYVTSGIITNLDNVKFDCNNAAIISSSYQLGYGIYAPYTSSYSSGVDNIIIKNCIIKNFYYGVALFNSTNDTVENNVFINNTRGLAFGSSIIPSLNNVAKSNTFLNNQIGLLIPAPYSGNNNQFIHNNFISNVIQAQFTTSSNIWSNPQIGGNHWSNYGGADNNLDSFGDTPYTISTNNIDNLPLIHPKFLSVDGTTTFGNSFKLRLNDPLDSGKEYIILMAFSNTPPIQLPDGRRIYLQADPLFFFSIGYANTPGFQNSWGNLNSNGQAIATVVVPNNPALAVLNVYFAALIFDPTAPSGVRRISHTIKVTI
ncbi:MAG: NosD domain-containing protein, partial [Nanoarchaeota archaeon]